MSIDQAVLQSDPNMRKAGAVTVALDELTDEIRAAAKFADSLAARLEPVRLSRPSPVNDGPQDRPSGSPLYQRLHEMRSELAIVAMRLRVLVEEVEL